MHYPQKKAIILQVILKLGMEPRIGFEPTTYALRMRCSTN